MPIIRTVGAAGGRGNVYFALLGHFFLDKLSTDFYIPFFYRTSTHEFTFDGNSPSPMLVAPFSSTWNFVTLYPPRGGCVTAERRSTIISFFTTSDSDLSLHGVLGAIRFFTTADSNSRVLTRAASLGGDL